MKTTTFIATPDKDKILAITKELEKMNSIMHREAEQYYHYEQSIIEQDENGIIRTPTDEELREYRQDEKAAGLE